MTTLEKLQLLDTQINDISKEIKKGGYKAAGLVISLSIGQNGNYISDIQLGVYSCIEERVLTLILEGLVTTKEVYLHDLRKESEKIVEYLNKK